ncbi:hypothetical protein WPS_20990 [Vulcanimicrobium alpinum]|uniref:SpoVT-AbrB domain-containing protein n=1 Tax=Vulcanimicrobium alpinum TaxID=3016050 RepID=A0AAN2CAE0_UNVUL|nr:hypothetical protein WPS_20990 [Vulcanimicrobium alpinum]
MKRPIAADSAPSGTARRSTSGSPPATPYRLPGCAAGPLSTVGSKPRRVALFDLNISLLHHCFPMRITLRRIGNAQGVVLPKAILAEVGFERDIDMAVEGGAVVF